MNLPELYNDVRQCAKEYAFQWTWTKREKRPNICLAVSRVYLELAMALYRVEARRAYK